MQLTIARWACLFTGILASFAGSPVKCVIFMTAWGVIGIYQMKTGKF